MLQVGQKLYWAPSGQYHMCEQEISVGTVGQKWATIIPGNYRIDIQTLRADGGFYSSPGKCYPNKDAFLAEREAKQAWDHLWRKMGSRLPDGVTAADINQAMQILRVSP